MEIISAWRYRLTKLTAIAAGCLNAKHQWFASNGNPTLFMFEMFHETSRQHGESIANSKQLKSMPPLFGYSRRQRQARGGVFQSLRDVHHETAFRIRGIAFGADPVTAPRSVVPVAPWRPLATHGKRLIGTNQACLQSP